MSMFELNQRIKLADHYIGANDPVYIIAEMSANHLQDYNRAVEIIHAAKEAGVDAIKLQTYTADTITIDSDKSYFQITGGTIWDGTTLHKLYEEAYTPWDWQPKLCEEAGKLGLDCFSSPFDSTAVDFMEQMDMPAYKIASYEITDIAIVDKIVIIFFMVSPVPFDQRQLLFPQQLFFNPVLHLSCKTHRIRMSHRNVCRICCYDECISLSNRLVSP